MSFDSQLLKNLEFKFATAFICITDRDSSHLIITQTGLLKQICNFVNLNLRRRDHICRYVELRQSHASINSLLQLEPCHCQFDCLNMQVSLWLHLISCVWQFIEIHTMAGEWKSASGFIKNKQWIGVSQLGRRPFEGNFRLNSVIICHMAFELLVKFVYISVTVQVER